MLKYLLYWVVFIFSVSWAAAYGVKDSIGVEVKKGKTYIVHKVEPKETLYSLSRKYNVSVDDIKNANDGELNMQVGQTVLVPSKNVSKAVVRPSGTKTHKVEPKETLYSISRKYQVTVDALKKANQGVDITDLKIGQVLNIPSASSESVSVVSPTALPKTHKVEAKETLYSISRKYNISVDDLKKANEGVNITELQVGQVINLSASNAVALTGTAAVSKPAEPKKPQDKKETEMKAASVKLPAADMRPESNLPEIKKEGYTKVNESGFVEKYEIDSQFHYALHKTAPIGTIILLESEDQKVYVRVMGRLTEASSGVIMKISQKAFDKISKGGASKVKVSSSYIP